MINSLSPSDESVHSRSSESRARRDLWVQARLLDVFMHNSYSGTPLRLLILVCTGALLWQEVDHQRVLLWALVGLLTIGARHLIYHHYLRIHDELSEAKRLVGFKRRVGWVWAASGLVWAGAYGLSHGQVSLPLQTALLLVMVAFVAMAVDRYSPWPTVLYAYTVCSMGGVIVIMLVQALSVGWTSVPLADSVLMLIVGLCWLVLLMGGDRFHRVLQSTFRLQYRNQQLTRSLTRKTEAALRAVALKNRLLAAASHDIRQPIHALSLYAQYLSADPSQSAELAPRIVQASRAVNSLFDSLLSYAQIEAGGLALHVEPVRVDKVLRDLCVVYEPVARSKGLALRLRLPAQPVVMSSDSVQLRRILGNLLDNAIKYTQQGGVLVALRLRNPAEGPSGPDVLDGQDAPRRARICVVDTGLGIPDQYQGGVFDEFVSVPSFARNSACGGVGLGLAIVARLSQALGHDLSMSSRAGRGSVFRIDLDDARTHQVQHRGDAAAVPVLPAQNL